MASVPDRINNGLRGEIVYATVGGPTYKTTISRSGSGYEKRSSEWLYPLNTWEWGERVVDERELGALLAFFHARRGRAIGFRFKDWADYKVAATEGQLSANGAGQYQLFKHYGAGALRKIGRPVAETVKLYADGVETTAFTLDAETGLLTTSATGALSWSGEFDALVRFDSDTLKHQFKLVDKTTGRALFVLHTLPLQEYLESQ